jgi:two-component system CheB/CheR fusion protein
MIDKVWEKMADQRDNAKAGEPSKDEPRPGNEELQTMNAELRHQVEELTRANADMQNLIANSKHRQSLLLRELQHRVRNLLATVRGLAARTRAESDSADEFWAAFDGRLAAVERVQSLEMISIPDHINFMDLVLDELNAHDAQVGQNAEVEGPELVLEKRAAQTLALAIHELATNAAKYGALCTEAGRLSLRWQIADRTGTPHLVLRWKESGVEIDSEVAKTGFGRRLIEEAVPYELGGKTTLTFPPDGCACIMEIPFSDRIMRAEDLRGRGEEAREI